MLVITRHPALLDFLIEEGVVPEGTTATSHATPEIVAGQDVVGVLPHSLSCLTQTYTEVSLRIPAEMRGKELTLSQLRDYSQGVATYTVTRCSK